MNITGGYHTNILRPLLVVLLLMGGSTLAGCLSTGGRHLAEPNSHPGDYRDPLGVRYLAASIKGQLRHSEVLDQGVVVTTFVDLNNLSQSSVFGRLLTERTVNEMHRSGFTVSELRKGRDILLREELGELILTRDTRESLGRVNARAILAGTYVATEKSIIINTRLIDIDSPLILSSSSYDLKMTDELRKLLTGESPF